MSAGAPSFNVKPRSLEDYPKVDILKPAIDQVLEEANFGSILTQFLTDGSVIGTSGIEVASEWPQCKDENGKARRDFTRPRIVMRPRNGMEMLFDPSMQGHHTKGATAWRERMSDDQFEQDYRIVTLIDGTKKFPNAMFVKPGVRVAMGDNGIIIEREAGLFDYKGIELYHIQDPIQNYYRIYANNVLIYGIPLHMRRLKDGSFTKGDNALGDTRIAVWCNNDQYDDNDATHALYGAPEHWLMKGLNRMYQDFSNMMVDNYALANTFALSFKPNQGVIGGLDLDSTDFYSGMFINGEIISTPFGQVRLQDFANVKEILDEWCFIVTGSNFKGIVGDQGSTAFEVASRIRANNVRYGFKLKKLEETSFKKLGKMVLSSIFTTYTASDFEIVTGKDREEIARQFSNGEIAESDLQFGEGVMPDGTKQKMIVGLKYKTMIKVPGKIYNEKLGKDGKRLLDGTMSSTLSEDITKRGSGDSFVPADEEYILTKEYRERGIIPEVIVDTGAMIAGQKQVQINDFMQLSSYAQNRAVMSATNPQIKELQTDFDLKKFDLMAVELTNFSKENVMKDNSNSAQDQEELEKLNEAIRTAERAASGSNLPTPPPNVQVPPQPQNVPQNAAIGTATG